MAANRERTATPGIFRRGTRYDVSYRDPQGRQRWRSARTLTEARALKAALKADVERGEYRELSRTTFAAYAAEWIETYTGRTGKGIRASTLGDYRRDLAGRAVPYFGKKRLVEIEPRHIKAFAKTLKDEGLADTTVRRIIAPLKALFATAKEEGLIRSHPAEGIRLAGGRSKRGEAVRALSEGELAVLLEEVPEEWRLLIDFLSQTGLRIGEAVELRWGDLDLGRRRAKVSRAWYEGRVEEPKSSYGVRAIPLSEGLSQRLWEWRKASAATADGDLVFPGSTGRRLQAGNLRSRTLKPAAVRAGLVDEEGGTWVGFHSLRHTCATRYFRAGANVKQVQAILGHHSPAFTLERYVHLLPDDLPDPGFLDRVPGAARGPGGGNKVVTRGPKSDRNPRVRKAVDSR